jgi:hypothetical protein
LLTSQLRAVASGWSATAIYLVALNTAMMVGLGWLRAVDQTSSLTGHALRTLALWTDQAP